MWRTLLQQIYVVICSENKTLDFFLSDTGEKKDKMKWKVSLFWKSLTRFLLCLEMDLLGIVRSWCPIVAIGQKMYCHQKSCYRHLLAWWAKGWWSCSGTRVPDWVCPLPVSDWCRGWWPWKGWKVHLLSCQGWLLFTLSSSVLNQEAHNWTWDWASPFQREHPHALTHICL